jgi:cobaltochelatase CobN
MGGMNLAVRNVTGKDPDAYFNDFRNKYNPKMQGAKEAIWTEARTTLFNENYIKELAKGGPSAAEEFAETFRNTYGWNVMKPSAVDDEIWNNLHDVYVRDEKGLNLHTFFKDKNPYALQEMTAVMMETARKGLWEAASEQKREIANLHGSLLKDHKAGCSGFVCNNSKLRDYFSAYMDPALAAEYNERISEAIEAPIDMTEESVVLAETEKKKIQENKPKLSSANQNIHLTVLGIALLVLLMVITIYVRKRRI